MLKCSNNVNSRLADTPLANVDKILIRIYGGFTKNWLPVLDSWYSGHKKTRKGPWKMICHPLGHPLTEERARFWDRYWPQKYYAHIDQWEGALVTTEISRENLNLWLALLKDNRLHVERLQHIRRQSEEIDSPWKHVFDHIQFSAKLGKQFLCDVW